MKLLMIDIETLGVSVEAPVLSVGAVMVDTADVRPVTDLRRVYVVLNLLDQLLNRSEDNGTLEWWSRRSLAVSGVISEAVTTTADNFELLRPIFSLAAEADEVWCEGQFDIPILTHLGRQLGFAEYAEPDPQSERESKPQLWSFRKERDLRTLAKCLPGVKRPDRDHTYHHHALYDAIHQMQYLCDLLEYLEKVQGLEPASFIHDSAVSFQDLETPSDLQPDGPGPGHTTE